MSESELVSKLIEASPCPPNPDTSEDMHIDILQVSFVNRFLIERA